jgi:hypothetical protein
MPPDSPSAISALLKVKSLREASRVKLYFTEPILDWREVHTRFFQMVHKGFQGKLPVHASELSGVPGAATIGDLRARWSIYGGSSSVTLFADRLEFDFPALAPSDYPLAWDILRTIHDLLPATLERWQYDKIESSAFEHLEIPAHVGVADYLERFMRSEINAAFADTDVVAQPGIKFRLSSQIGSWDCELVMEKSLFNAAAIFIVRNVTMYKVDATASFENKVMRGQDIARRCLAALGLEHDNATGS